MARTSTQAAGQQELIEQLQWRLHHSSHDERECSILTLCPLERQVGDDSTGRQAAHPVALDVLADRLRRLIRRSDDIEVDGQRGISLVLHGADQKGVRAVFQRVRDALQVSPLPDELAVIIAIGYATASTTCVGDPVAIAEAVRAARKPRALITIGLPVLSLAHQLPARPPSGNTGNQSARGRARCASSLAEQGALTPAESSTVAPEEHMEAGVPEPIAPVRRGALRLVMSARAETAAHAALRAQACSLGVPFMHLPRRLPVTCCEAIPAAVASELRAVPIGRARNMLTVAMQNPCDSVAVCRLRTITGLSIFPVLAASDELDRALRQLARD